jgi:hypothetical protein
MGQGVLWGWLHVSFLRAFKVIAPLYQWMIHVAMLCSPWLVLSSPRRGTDISCANGAPCFVLPEVTPCWWLYIRGSAVSVNELNSRSTMSKAKEFKIRHSWTMCYSMLCCSIRNDKMIRNQIYYPYFPVYSGKSWSCGCYQASNNL